MPLLLLLWWSSLLSPLPHFTPYCECIFFWSRALFVVDVVTVSCLLDPVLCSLGPGWLEITCFLPSVLFVLPSLLFLSVLSLICLFVKNVWVKFNARSLLFSPVPLSLPPLCLLFCCLFCVCVQVWTRRQTKGVRGEGVFFSSIVGRRGKFVEGRWVCVFRVSEFEFAFFLFLYLLLLLVFKAPCSALLLIENHPRRKTECFTVVVSMFIGAYFFPKEDESYRWWSLPSDLL